MYSRRVISVLGKAMHSRRVISVLGKAIGFPGPSAGTSKGGVMQGESAQEDRHECTLGALQAL